MNRRIDSVPPEEPGLISGDRRVEHADDSRLSRIRRIFREATSNIMQGDVESLRESLAELKDGLLDFFRSEPVEEDVDERLVNAEVKAFTSTEGLKESNKKLSYLTNRNKDLEDRVRRSLKSEEEAKRCGLTGLLHKRFFLRKMTERLGILKREAHDKEIPVSAVFFDIDKFKKVNDTYGHDPGDEVISKIGRAFSDKFQREGDVTGKFGGDEFIMLLSHCNNENAVKLLEELRQEIEALEFTAFENGNTETFNVTISIGVLTASLHRLNGKYKIVDLVKVLIKGADEQLYESKENGRNRVTGVSVDMETVKVLIKKEEKAREKREAEKEAEKASPL
jgi:diguanylate cyclase (GGDEF)-like protein